LQKLKTAEADAREVATLLKDAYGFETKLLLNATRQQIMSALYSYRRELNADSNLLIYYAGHGVNDKEADKAYWLPVDASRDDNSNWIIADEITTALKVIPAKHVLVISDSCYSGTLTRGLGESLPRPTEREQFLRKMAAGRSRTLMASGGDEPVADGGGGSHSIFAGALLRGLKEMDKAQFTAAELFRNHVEESVAGRANQTPEYNPLRNSGHESGDFIFARVKVDGKTAEVAVTEPLSAKVDAAQQELAFWSSIQSSTDAEDFKDYLAKYPTGIYAGIAQRRVVALSTEAKPAPVTPSVKNAAPTAVKFSEYVTPDLSANKAQLDEFVLALQQDPTAQGYLITYGGRTSRPEDAQKAVDNATNYTINVRKIAGVRTLSGVGGYREQPTVELWIAPVGATPPLGTPTVDPKDVRPTSKPMKGKKS